MLIRKIAGCTHDIGKDQGYLNLPIRVTPSDIETAGATHKTVLVESAWEPDPKELAMLNEGMSVIVQLVGALPHPPIKVYVDSSPHPPVDTIGSMALEIQELAERMQRHESHNATVRREYTRSPTAGVNFTVMTLANEIYRLAGLIHEEKI